MKLYILLVCIAAAITFLMTAVMRRVSLEWKILTPVRDRDVHATPTPRLGGVAMATGFALTLVIASTMPYFAPVFSHNHALWAVLAGALGTCILGVIDDVWELDWTAKLAGQILIAVMMAYFGVQLISFPIFGITIGSSMLSLLATVFVVVATMNAVNFVDGLDGLAAGVIGIGATAFFTYSYILTRVSGAQTYATAASLIMVLLIGICLGFLPHNFHPASIFMGDSGALTLGTILAGGGIIITGQVDPLMLGESQALTAVLPILLPVSVVLIPLTDMTMAVIRRTLAGKSPFHADRLHIHHRLLGIGHSHVGVVLLMYLWAAVITFPMVALMIYPVTTVALIAAPAILTALVLTYNFLPGLRRRSRHASTAAPHLPALPATPPRHLDTKEVCDD